MSSTYSDSFPSITLKLLLFKVPASRYYVMFVPVSGRSCLGRLHRFVVAVVVGVQEKIVGTGKFVGLF